MELSLVEAFVGIVHAGGFTRASKQLHVSQPAISRRIQQLEDALGAPMFDRLPTGAVISEAGRAFLPHAESMLASMRDGIEAVSVLRGTARGTISLAIVGSLASTALTQKLRAFRTAHPATDLRLRTALSNEVSALVQRGDVALGVRYHQDSAPELVSVTVYEEPMVAICASDNRLAQARTVRPADLRQERWITFPPAGSAPEPYATALNRLLAAAGLTDAEIIPIDSLTAQKRLVEAGFGVALLPRSSVTEEVETGTLQVMTLTTPPMTIPVVLVRRRGAFAGAATKALTRLLQDWPSNR